MKNVVIWALSGVLLGIATFYLIRSMNKQLRKIPPSFDAPPATDGPEPTGDDGPNPAG